jgi:hypothetical protein
VKVDTPLGEYPLALRRIEGRGGDLAIVGLFAGVEASVVLERRELRRALALAGVVTLLFAARRSTRCPS